ncbi:MAG: response regulator [Anaeromyxobacteraceae bacterium]
MGSVNRVALAEQAYRDALAAARADSSPHTWRRLVRAGQNLRDAQPKRAGALRGGPGPSVLLVEDDVATREALRDILSEQRIRVWTATDGCAALELLRSGRITPSVIVMDLFLPRMSGFELREALRGDAALARIPVVAMSGDRNAQIDAARRFEKPFDATDLVEALLELAQSA